MVLCSYFKIPIAIKTTLASSSDTILSSSFSIPLLFQTLRVRDPSITRHEVRVGSQTFWSSAKIGEVLEKQWDGKGGPIRQPLVLRLEINTNHKLVSHILCFQTFLLKARKKLVNF